MISCGENVVEKWYKWGSKICLGYIEDDKTLKK
jgi:hypothetical protein